MRTASLVTCASVIARRHVATRVYTTTITQAYLGVEEVQANDESGLERGPASGDAAQAGLVALARLASSAIPDTAACAEVAVGVWTRTKSSDGIKGQWQCVSTALTME